ncbi:MAG: MBL fold metallo-hydrolase [Chthonomonas sp.]|nr:MBL fold metallo-hydrolase [Chthonomonas sp.]
MIFEVEPGRIWGIDSGLGHERCTAVYVLRAAAGWVLIDCSAAACSPRVLAGLAEIGVDALVGILPTHVHLDHAGGAGVISAQFPGAKVIAHPRAARHLANPSRLVAGAREVWGAERFAALYGETLPVPEDRLVVAEDGDEYFGLRFFDAPGHARHHYMVWDETSGTLFAGDAFGLAYEGGVSYPSSSPVQFDPDAARATIRQIVDLKPERVAIAHFGVLQDVAARAEQLIEMLDEFEAVARRYEREPDRVPRIREALRELHPPNANRERYETDIEINADGLDFWLRSQSAGYSKSS